MKRLLYYIFFASFFVLLSSCTNEEDNKFDGLPMERINAINAECMQVLTEEPKGWLMEYYAGMGDDKMGAYNIWCTFDKEGWVTMSADFTDATDKSLYRFNGDTGPVITFDSQNDILHVFSAPQSGPTTFDGDYEFRIVSVSPEYIELKGKRYGSKITLKPFPTENGAQKQYLNNVGAMINKVVYPKFEILVNNDVKGNASFSELRAFKFDTPGVANINSMNICFTPNGFHFFEPVVLDGQTAVNFEWDDASTSYICTDQGINVVLKAIEPPANYLRYNDYAGNYVLSYKNNNGGSVTKNVTLSKKSMSLTYEFLLEGLHSLPINVTYSIADGRLSILYQTMGSKVIGGAERSIVLFPLYPRDGYFYLAQDPEAGLVSVLKQGATGNVIGFEDNKFLSPFVIEALLISYIEDNSAKNESDDDFILSATISMIKQ